MSAVHEETRQEAEHAGCANCGAGLAGAYCHVCGQRAHLHRSLLHFGEELLHGLVHFDAKGWRTLPLLVARPGELTRRYIDGQRTRHLSPLALFLFSMFLLFFVFSLTARAPGTLLTLDPEERAQARSELAKAVEDEQASMAARQKALADARARAAGVTDAEADLAVSRQKLKVVEAALAAFDAGGLPPKATLAAEIHTGWPTLDNAIVRQLENPDLALYKLKSAASKYSIMLVPLSLPFLWLLFIRRRDVVMYDHAVFALYSLSFMALLFVCVALLGQVVRQGPLVAVVMGVPPVHMFLQLRGAYGLTTWGALWRTCALLVFVGLVFLLYLVLIAVASA